MSDNREMVKVIIEIPKETYLEIKEGLITRNAIASAEIIQNGIPLDDVKAEFINRYPKNFAGEPELGGASCHFSLCKVLEILDNIGKAESEE